MIEVHEAPQVEGLDFGLGRRGRYQPPMVEGVVGEAEPN